MKEDIIERWKGAQGDNPDLIGHFAAFQLYINNEKDMNFEEVFSIEIDVQHFVKEWDDIGFNVQLSIAANSDEAGEELLAVLKHDRQFMANNPVRGIMDRDRHPWRGIYRTRQIYKTQRWEDTTSS